jgi:hypothetical protein
VSSAGSTPSASGVGSVVALAVPLLCGVALLDDAKPAGAG